MHKKVMVITGISSGIGEALANHFCTNGWIVIGTVRNPIDQNRLEKENLHVVIGDVREPRLGDKIVEKLNQNQLNSIHVLINNAGIAVGGPLELLTEDEFEEQLDVNVKAVRRISNACIPKMNDDTQVNKIINISSVSGVVTYPFLGAYCVSKHALESLSDAYRRELKPYNIDVITIQPGPIKTPIWGKSKSLAEKYSQTKYGEALSKLQKGIVKSLDEALEVDEVVTAIEKAIAVKGPTNRVVAKNKWLIYLIKNLLPPRWLDKAIFKSVYN
jgi:NAD(P)-dependent dehydrogenase (short-subunit alcohol dehydrogenase family)